MSTLIEQIEAMRIRMNELATEEHELVRTLGEELSGCLKRFATSRPRMMRVAVQS